MIQSYIKQPLTNNLLSAIALTQVLFRPNSRAAESNCNPVPAGLVSWWTGNGHANDVVGESHGTREHGAAFASGKVGQAFSFNGTYSDVVVADNPSLTITRAITIDAWINPTELAGRDRAILAKHDSSIQSSSFQFTVLSDGKLFFSVYDTPATHRVVTSEHSVVPVGVFTHVAATFSSTTQSMRLYVNGSEVSTIVIDDHRVDSIFSSTARVRIGATTTTTGLADPFEGLIDEVDLFARELTASEIRSIYSAGSAGKCVPTSSLNRISFQGMLNDSMGNALSDGVYRLTFRLYNGSTTTLALATSNVPNVPVTSGVASTVIPVEDAWFDGHTRYLGVSIDNGPELSPRVLITTVPRAMIANRAAVAESLSSPIINVSGFLQFDPVAANDPQAGTWTIDPSAFRSGNFGIVRSSPSADQTKSLVITPNGNVGVGISSPTTKLDVNGGIHATTLNLAGGPADPVLNVAGVTRTTVLQITSDRNAKQQFEPVDSRVILAKLAKLPIASWAYTNNPSIRHVGPVAQDFHAVFGMGEDDKHIATVDADGVALAAIQGLHSIVAQQQLVLQQRDIEVRQLQDRVWQIEQLLFKRTTSDTE